MEKSKTCGENYKLRKKKNEEKKEEKTCDRKEKKTRYAHLIEPGRRGRGRGSGRGHGQQGLLLATGGGCGSAL